MTQDNRTARERPQAEGYTGYTQTEEYTQREYERKRNEEDAYRLPPLSVSELRREARELSKRRRGLFPNILLLNALLIFPSLILYSISVLNFPSDSISYIFFQIAATLLPIILGGPFALGLSGSFLSLSRGENKIRTSSLFYGLKDRHFPRAFGAFLLTALISAMVLCLLLLPGTALYIYNENRVISSYGILALAILLLLAGAVCAFFFLLRFSLTFWFMADNGERRTISSIAAGFHTMRGNCIRYFLLIFSYIGWYLVAFAVALFAVLIFTLAGYSRVSSMETLFDQYAYLVYLVFYIRIFSVAAIVITLSAVASRPLFATAVFFNRITGYRPPEPKKDEAETEAEETIPEKTDEEDLQPPENSAAWPPKPDREDLPVTRTVWESRDADR